MASQRRNKSKEDKQPGAPAWMVTYGDLMSLLLTFFVLLLSFSSISEPEKFQEAMISIQNALGIFKYNTDVVPLPYPEVGKNRERLRQIARELRRRMQVKGTEEQLDVRYDEEQGILHITLPSAVLFDSGSAVLKAEANSVLEDVAELLAGMDSGFFEVRGHTDNRPLTSGRRYRDNYDLSYARAKTVTAFLQEAGGISLERFELVAQGPSRPMANNETPEGREANRRVEIFVRGDLGEEAVERLKEYGASVQPMTIEPAETGSPEAESREPAG